MKAADAWELHLEARVEAGSLRGMLAAGSLPQAFAETAAAGPDRPALTIAGATHTHGELDGQAGLTAGWLRSSGVQPGDRVMITGTSSHELIQAYMGTLRSGAATMLVDEGSTRTELLRLVEDGEPVIALMSPVARDSLGPLAEEFPLGVHALEDLPKIVGAANPLDPPSESEAQALLAYTSGSTGAPKGVPLSHGNVLSSIRAAMLAWQWSADDVLVHALPLSHQHGLSGVNAALLSGSHTVVEPRFAPATLCARIEEHAATVLFAVPAMYERLGAWEGIASAKLSSLRLAVSGSAPLPPALSDSAAEWLGQRPLERYGSTEAGLVLSNLYSGERAAGKVGYPLPGIEVDIREGELLVKGPQVFGGYRDRPEETVTAFTEDGWFRSGDVAAIDEAGAYAITGRIKEMIITGGLNVFPREVETTLEEHPAVTRAAVVGASSERWGEEVVAFVVARPGAVFGPEEIKNFCKERLSSYKCPKRVLVIDELPVTRMGKVRRDLLAELAAQNDGENPIKEIQWTSE